MAEGDKKAEENIIYTVQLETTIEVQWGPLGLFRHKEPVTLPTGIEIREGQTTALSDMDGMRVGTAEINKGILIVNPEKDVVVEFEGKDDLVLRFTDGGKKVRLKQLKEEETA